MSFVRCCHLATLLLASTLGLSLSAQAPQPAEAPPPSHITYPQIVRLSLVEGDVRIARGKQDEKLTGNAWEQATADIPLESGFSLATGADGRAEIEFEDDSTLYLAPNSALALAQLTSKDGVPHTQLSLLSGTITTYLDPTVPGEQYILQTATHVFTLNYGERSYARVTSYLDAMQITPMRNQNLVGYGTSFSAAAGESYNIIGPRVVPTHASAAPAQAAWDKWVADRISARNDATQTVMHQANLSTPIPGLADLANKGTFTSCAP